MLCLLFLLQSYFPILKTSSNDFEEGLFISTAWHHLWHSIVYVLVALIVIMLCCPFAYCCCYKRYRRHNMRRRLETEVTMPRLMDTTFNELHQDQQKALNAANIGLPLAQR